MVATHPAFVPVDTCSSAWRLLGRLDGEALLGGVDADCTALTADPTADDDPFGNDSPVMGV